MKSQLTLYLSALLLSSCSGNHDTAHTIELHDLSITTDVSIDSIFSDVEVTPLRFEQDTYPSTVFNGRVTDDVIIVSDDHSLIHVFAKDGHYISCSQNMPNGEILFCPPAFSNYIYQIKNPRSDAPPATTCTLYTTAHFENANV